MRRTRPRIGSISFVVIAVVIGAIAYMSAQSRRGAGDRWVPAPVSQQRHSLLIWILSFGIPVVIVALYHRRWRTAIVSGAATCGVLGFLALLAPPSVVTAIDQWIVILFIAGLIIGFGRLLFTGQGQQHKQS